MKNVKNKQYIYNFNIKSKILKNLNSVVEIDTHTYYILGIRNQIQEQVTFNPTLGFTLLFVANPQKSSLFYQEILGLKPIEKSPTFVLFALKNGVMLSLWSKYTAEPRVDAPAGAFEICFPTENVNALYEDWGRKHVTVAQKPTDMDFGRTFVILDPDRHRIRVYKLHEEK